MITTRVILFFAILTAMLLSCEDKQKSEVVAQRSIIITVNGVDHKFEGEATMNTPELLRFLDSCLNEVSRDKKGELSVSVKCQIRRGGVMIKDSHMQIKLTHHDQNYVAERTYGPLFETEPSLNRMTYGHALTDVYDFCEYEITRWNETDK